MSTPSYPSSGRASGRASAKACPDFERLLALYAWDELEPARRASVEQHVAGCPACAAALEHERRLIELLAAAESEAPSDLFLATCRRTLADTLDNTSAEIGWFGRLRLALGRLRVSGWVTEHPALSAALLVLVGMAIGRIAPPSYRPGVETTGKTAPAAQSYTSAEAARGEITGIRRLSGNGVEVLMTSERPLVVQGLPADRDVRLALVRALRAGDNYDPDVRLDSVELLKPQMEDTDVRQALCQAARSDLNTSVRLKAVEALRGFEKDDLVRQTLLDALQHDTNPGVRVEAVSALRTYLESQTDQTPLRDDRITRVLADRKAKDPNEFVRLQSAAAMQQIAARKEY
jgi:hypothetical protein